MTDLSDTITARSDQMNAIDLVSGPVTITITKVSKVSGDQPVAINYAGDEGKPFKPCKSVRRLLVGMWGADASKYAGRRLTLFRDPKVLWAGKEEGGIRVSHASDISGDFKMPLAVSKGKSAMTTVRPLASAPTPKPIDPNPFDFDRFESLVTTELDASTDAEELTNWWTLQKPERMRAGAADKDRAIKVADRVNAKIAELAS